MLPSHKKWKGLKVLFTYRCNPESIERFIEGQAFLRSDDSAPRPPPASPISNLSFFLFPVCHRSSLLTGEGGGGEEPNIKTRKSLADRYFGNRCVHLPLTSP